MHSKKKKKNYKNINQNNKKIQEFSVPFSPYQKLSRWPSHASEQICLWEKNSWRLSYVTRDISGPPEQQ